ncbi:MAG TPA: fused MFS/spermidine synthase, partial [Novosphingobium sp.]|nr:fused MFS/spermidine synthase [Novosphingobium sp.]
LIIAATTLPIHLAALAPPAPGREALWVPWLFAASIGPVFLLVSAQAPLMQRWFSAHPAAGEPWALYAASNLGSFAGLIAYPLLAEPLLSVRAQTWAWSAGYALLIAWVAAAAWARWTAPAAPTRAEPAQAVGAKRVLAWLALAAVPSGLMLSTTTHLTTDIFAMPLLWVIPLGLYLLSFVPAFSDRRALANATQRAAAPIVLLAGGMAMGSRSSGSIALALASVVLLFVVAVTLHARLYALRPDPSRLTLFYLVMAAGGALGGAFTALVAPLAFDWVWEHPLLVVAAALLLPQTPLLGWTRLEGMSRAMVVATVLALVALAGFAAWIMLGLDPEDDRLLVLFLALAMAFSGVMVLGRRWAFVAVLALTMIGRGGFDTLETSLSGARSRSYFGIYTVRDYPESHQRMLSHGTTLHGMQYTDARSRRPTTYYGPNSGVGLALARAPALFGPNARIGVVGLGTGTLACWKQPGQRWTFFEIDRAVLALSRSRRFTYLDDCAPDATVRLGDARLELGKLPPASFDVLAIDAFSSDAIPLHLLTEEALRVYGRALAPDGLLMVHISNRYFELEPQLSASLARAGWAGRVLTDTAAHQQGLSASVWVAVARDEARLARLTRGEDKWKPLLNQPGTRPWSDDHASILAAVRWRNLIGKVF